MNNIYFDSLDKDNYQNNIDGIGDRHKVRIRWYNNFFGYVKEPKLEIKSKKNHQANCLKLRRELGFHIKCHSCVG